MTGKAPDLDRELADLPQELRWREWMRRIEAVLFAADCPVSRADLARVVGSGASVDLLLDDLSADLAERPYDIARIGGGWMLRTRPSYAAAIRAATPATSATALGEHDMALLAAIAYHQPVTRAELAEIFGQEISRDRIGRLHRQGLIGSGPRSPRPGAPYTFVTTDAFLATFGLASLRDLPDLEQLDDSGLSV